MWGWGQAGNCGFRNGVGCHQCKALSILRVGKLAQVHTSREESRFSIHSACPSSSPSNHGGLSPALCPILCNAVNCSLPGLYYPWDSPGKNTRLGCHVLLQRIFPTQGSNLSLMFPALAGGFLTTSTTWETQQAENTFFFSG